MQQTLKHIFQPVIHRNEFQGRVGELAHHILQQRLILRGNIRMQNVQTVLILRVGIFEHGIKRHCRRNNIIVIETVHDRNQFPAS